MSKPEKETISLIQPKLYQEVGAKFIIAGWVPKDWLRFGKRIDYRISLEFYGIDAQVFMGSSINFYPHLPGWLLKLKKRIYFQDIAGFTWTNIPFLEKSQGCINIRLDGCDKEQTLFIPLIVKQFVPKNGISQEIKDKHGRIGEIVKQYEKDLENYNKGIAEIMASRKAKDNNEDPRYLCGPNAFFSSEILKIIESSDDNFREYAYSEEDKRERGLNEKYKDALEWRGPLLRGIVSQFNGFELRVHSDDHGKHFHIIHKGKGINARFSFPEMHLVSYVNSRNTIGSKLEKSIREFCLQPEIFKKFEEEFQKRDGYSISF